MQLSWLLEENQLGKHGLLILAVIGCLLTGTFINQNPSETASVAVNKDFSCNLSKIHLNPLDLLTSNNVSAHWTFGLVIGLSVVLPLLPELALGSSNQMEERICALVSHALGQSSTFASNEFIRHFLILPDKMFVEKCNVSEEVCYQRSLQYVPLNTFCNNSTLPFKDIFSSLHSVPDIAFSMLGSSAILLFFNIDLLKKKSLLRRHQEQKETTTAGNQKIVSYFKLTIALLFMFLMSLAVIYQYRQSQNTVSEIIISFLYGALLQCLIVYLFQAQYKVKSPYTNNLNANVNVLKNIV